MIEADNLGEDATARGRPRWFIPALLGVGLGGLLGLAILLLPQGVPTTTALISPRPTPAAGASLAAPSPSVQIQPDQPAATTPARWTRTLVAFAEVLRPARIFVFHSVVLTKKGEDAYGRPHIAPIASESTAATRFVLYDDGTFALQFAWRLVGEPPSEARGRYTEANGVITFDRWDWEGLGGPYGATGRLEGNLLSVFYSGAMVGDEYQHAVYLRTQ